MKPLTTSTLIAVFVLSLAALPAAQQSTRPKEPLIDRTGRIAATYLGVVDPENLETSVKALLVER